MPPHAGFSHHHVSERTPSPTDNTSLGTAPEAAAGPTFQMLNPSPAVPSDWLPLELTLPEYLRNVTGVEDLSQLRHLKLRVITGEASIQRISIYAPSLVHLDLQGSCLGSLRDLGCGLLALKILSVSRCGLNSLDGTFGFPSLKQFNASYNKIKDVAPCSAIENLTSLDVRGNPIRDINSVGLLFLCSELEDLVLLECPVTEIPDYRTRVRKYLPTLKILDCVRFSDGPLLAEGEKKESDTIHRGAEHEQKEGSEKEGASNAERPSSAAARMQNWKPMLPSGGAKKRPQTARPHRHGDEESSFPIRVLVYDESPSSLTSGDAVCGNIASSLRSAMDGKPSIRNNACNVKERPDILDACRKWREAYECFRQKNRMKWEKEAEEEDDEGSRCWKEGK